MLSYLVWFLFVAVLFCIAILWGEYREYDHDHAPLHHANLLTPRKVTARLRRSKVVC
jgi:hypothetical protein